MKRIIVILGLLTGLLSSLAQAQMGCLSNSLELQQRFDPKAYYPKECNCPCDRYKKNPDRNQCPECGHFHDAKPFIMVTPGPQAALARNPYPKSPQESLQTLINRSRKGPGKI